MSAIIDRHLADLQTIFDDVSLTGDVETDLINMSRAFQKFQEKHQAVLVVGVGVQESFRKPNVSHAVEEIEINFKQNLLQYFAEMKKQHQIKETIDIEATKMEYNMVEFWVFYDSYTFQQS
ncbi:hypothetical protein [Leuconostoc mesenteroides]|uniref:hypothetical protein n=1 Tax=Leuconostoc mesenteroides TaxID=1245 RepID=UPI002E0E717F